MKKFERNAIYSDMDSTPDRLKQINTRALVRVSNFGFQVFRLRRTASQNNGRSDHKKKLMNVELA
jgi:hypothetical protein